MAQKKGQLTIECDEMWSFVGNKKNKHLFWLALDIETREIVGVYIGNRSRDGASGLWRSLPALYREVSWTEDSAQGASRQCAMCYTDFWAAYNDIFPECRHKAVSKTSGKTNGIEREARRMIESSRQTSRFNCTLRQRVSRLVRETLSFSKKLENHIGALLVFYPSL